MELSKTVLKKMYKQVRNSNHSIDFKKHYLNKIVELAHRILDKNFMKQYGIEVFEDIYNLGRKLHDLNKLTNSLGLSIIRIEK